MVFRTRNLNSNFAFFFFFAAEKYKMNGYTVKSLI